MQWRTLGIKAMLVWLIVAWTWGSNSSVARADDLRVAWKRIVGLVTPGEIVGAPGPGAPCDVGVDCVEGTPAPWTAMGGNAGVDFVTGAARFVVHGLVVAGDPSFANLGTTSIITRVKGTLVCNDTAPGVPELVDTESVRLDSQGNASWSGQVDLPPTCIDEPDDVVFLIRIASVRGSVPLVDRWIAFGAVRTVFQ
jgi:hypothetical protein